MDKLEIIELICAGFRETTYPGDAFLQGSLEGCEPYEATSPFRGKIDWRSIEPEFLDAHAGALSFFSEGGFRFFLPAFLIADVREGLVTADPLFHLTHGFFDGVTDIPAGAKTLRRSFGKSRLMNPKRYGAVRMVDHARFRLSVFTREESAAVVSYLNYKREEERDDAAKKQIDAAIDSFWLERARGAPTAGNLAAHRAEEHEFFTAILAGENGRPADVS